MPLIESLWLQCGPTMYFSLIAPDMPWDASAHIEVLEALRAGDAKMAQQAITRDVRTTAQCLLNGIAFQRSDGPLSFQWVS
jgi:DNA-binding GntR family transcriptional regulator